MSTSTWGMTKDNKLCSQTVREPGGWGHQYQCSRNGTYTDDGKKWCKQHLPSEVAKRHKASRDREHAAINRRRRLQIRGGLKAATPDQLWAELRTREEAATALELLDSDRAEMLTLIEAERTQHPKAWRAHHDADDWNERARDAWQAAEFPGTKGGK